MRASYLIIILISLTANLSPLNAQEEKIDVMSFNIRYDSPSDIEKGNGWLQRRPLVVSLIRHYSPDLLGIQEAMKHQLDYLLEHLPEYEFIGVARDDGKEKGEYSAILYKKERYELKENNTFWLSETPDKPSKSWDAALPRIVTWGAFKDKKTQEEFYYFNTHFDHIGTEAREQSAKLILKKIDAIAGDGPVILTGDFNVTPDTKPYAVLAEALADSRESSTKPPYGPEGTFSGFELKPTGNFRQIDFIFVRGLKVSVHETIADFFDDKFPSDHLPVMAEVY